MKDIVERLREAEGFALMDAARETVAEAADEIEKLRTALRHLLDQDATFSIIGGNMIVDVDGAGEIERLHKANGELVRLLKESMQANRGLLADVREMCDRLGVRLPDEMG